MYLFPKLQTNELFKARMTQELDRKPLEDFLESETSRDIKKSYKHHLYILKSCIDLQSYEGVAQKLRLPRPFGF